MSARLMTIAICAVAQGRPCHTGRVCIKHKEILDFMTITFAQDSPGLFTIVSFIGIVVVMLSGGFLIHRFAKSEQSSEVFSTLLVCILFVLIYTVFYMQDTKAVRYGLGANFNAEVIEKPMYYEGRRHNYYQAQRDREWRGLIDGGLIRASVRYEGKIYDIEIKTERIGDQLNFLFINEDGRWETVSPDGLDSYAKAMDLRETSEKK
ncbi:hypothetical protein E6Q11_06525 [Candidatus Dojkabacteria bacterium]|uniref:Uncharacterized protein n=1 Tax=Candidatus Dojkabacteria bacterium TaxID=2099670 RepID=A0A5C7J2S6_9BACT|nr:MAG: hypothetical protein E6Q11_06525 [Candidatus Dojkabacteria bacterium]